MLQTSSGHRSREGIGRVYRKEYRSSSSRRPASIPLRTNRKPSSIPRSTTTSPSAATDAGARRAESETELCGARTKGGSEHGGVIRMIEPQYRALQVGDCSKSLLNWFDHNRCFCVSAAGKLHDDDSRQNQQDPQALSRMHHFPKQRRSQQN